MTIITTVRIRIRIADYEPRNMCGYVPMGDGMARINL